MESYVTLKRENKTRHFYVYNDGQAREKGVDLTIHDFAGFFLFLAGDGWSLVKEINIPTHTKEAQTEMPLSGRSRKGEFIQDWFAYENANLANMF